MHKIIKLRNIIFLCISFITPAAINAQVSVFYKGDSICVSGNQDQIICFKSDYLHYGEYLCKTPLYLLDESSGALYIYNPKIELIQFDSKDFLPTRRIFFHSSTKEDNVKLEFIGNNVFLQSNNRLSLYNEDLCLIGDFNDSLKNSNPSINQMLIKDIEYRFDDSTITFDVISYSKRTPKLDTTSLQHNKYKYSLGRMVMNYK